MILLQNQEVLVDLCDVVDVACDDACCEYLYILARPTKLHPFTGLPSFFFACVVEKHEDVVIKAMHVQ